MEPDRLAVIHDSGTGKRFRDFFEIEAASGVLLMVSAAVALIWANSPIQNSYFNLWRLPVAGMSLYHWINDGLMALFFFSVGLEIKRELIQGELSSAAKAALPITAALGGMIVPAIVYTLFNFRTESASGWGIPMATDIAFAVGFLALLGKRVPPSLKVFLLALAVVDDLGAVLVIALFYSTHISWPSLGIGFSLLAILAGLSRRGYLKPLFYLFVGVIVWFAFLRSGVHATIAGVLLAFVIPPSTGLKVEHHLQPWVSFGIMPIFALANAGVALFGETSIHSVSIGIVAGLVLGKQVGITLFSWIGVRLGWSALPTGIIWRHLYGASCLGGIGFTMSIFIANLAFEGHSILSVAKIAVLAASVISAAWGLGVLALSLPRARTPLS